MAPVVILAAWPVLRRVIWAGIAGAVSVPAVTAVIWAMVGGSATAPISSAGGELAYRNPITAGKSLARLLYETSSCTADFRPKDLLFFALPVVVATLSVHWFRAGVTRDVADDFGSRGRTSIWSSGRS